MKTYDFWDVNIISVGLDPLTAGIFLSNFGHATPGHVQEQKGVHPDHHVDQKS